MKKLALATVSLLAVFAVNSAFAGDIYKWTDEDGNVHYGDRPVGEQPERMAISSQPTDPTRVQASNQARADSRIAKSEASAAAAAGAATAEQLKNEATERAARCTSVRAQMQQLVTSRRLYREDDSGERVYLDENESIAAREQVENQITEFCSG